MLSSARNYVDGKKFELPFGDKKGKDEHPGKKENGVEPAFEPQDDVAANEGGGAQASSSDNRGSLDSQILQKLRAHFGDVAKIEVNVEPGCDDKFSVKLVSASFEGVSKLNRQRMIHATLQSEMSAIHAITISCKTPEEESKA